MAPGQRPMQDFRAWKSYMTAGMWAEVNATPALASELLCQAISSLDGVNLSELSSAGLAAAALVAEHGPSVAPTLSDDEVQRMYHFVKASCYIDTYKTCGDHRGTMDTYKTCGDHRGTMERCPPPGSSNVCNYTDASASQARLKELKHPVAEYITLLPASPSLLLAQFPQVAFANFSATKVPVSFPLNETACAMVERRIVKRGGGVASASMSVQQLRGFSKPPCTYYSACGEHRNIHI